MNRQVQDFFFCFYLCFQVRSELKHNKFRITTQLQTTTDTKCVHKDNLIH